MWSLFQFCLALLLAVPLDALAQDSTSSSSAALLATLPSCALTCLVSGIEKSTCALTNQTCVCDDVQLQDSVSTCVTQNCTIKQALFTKNVTETVCQVPVQSKSQLSFAITVAFGVISGVAILVRIVFKAVVLKTELGKDDWVTLITFLCGLPSTSVATRGIIPNGLGRNVWTLTPDQVTLFAEYFYIMTVLYFLQVALLKIALLFFYLRIFPNQLIKRLLWITIAFVAVFGILFVALGIFQCQPISYSWTKWDGEHQGRCLSINAIAWANAAISITLDIWMLALPLSQIHMLQMDWKKKASVGIMFCVGGFITIVSIIRLQSLVSLRSTSNPTWDYTSPTDWSVIEINVGLICCCLPTLRLIVVRIFPTLGTKIYGSNSNNYYKSSSRGRPDTRNLPHSEHGPTQSGIYTQNTYTVHYSNEDERSLVPMQDLDQKGRDANFKSERSRGSTSELSI